MECEWYECKNEAIGISSRFSGMKLCEEHHKLTDEGDWVVADMDQVAEMLNTFHDRRKGNGVTKTVDRYEQLKKFISNLSDDLSDWRASQKGLALSLLEVFEERSLTTETQERK